MPEAPKDGRRAPLLKRGLDRADTTNGVELNASAVSRPDFQDGPRARTMRSRMAIGLAMAAAVAATGCNASKSSNPLSPSVAGPIAGVSITTPKPLTPTVGAAIEVGAQPVTLTLENASTNGQRPLNYLFEVALDAEFATKVVSREGVAPGDGTTSFKLPEALASERTYYWRARAQDGANTGAYSSGVHFSVFTPIVLQAPQLVSPVADTRIVGRTPTFRLTNAARSGPVGSIVYEFQVSANEAFNQLVATIEQGEQVSSTQAVYPGDLNYATRYYWRARAWEMTKNMPGPWSSTATFQTALAPAPTPEPTPAPVPVPGGTRTTGRTS